MWHISVADCLSACGRYDVVAVAVGYYYGIFSIRFSWEKTFALHFSRCVWGAKRKGLLCSIKISLVWFMDLMVSVICFLKFLLNKFRHAFAVVTPFLLTLVLLWYWEFITRPNKFNYSWYVILLLLRPSSNAICSR